MTRIDGIKRRAEIAKHFAAIPIDPDDGDTGNITEWYVTDIEYLLGEVARYREALSELKRHKHHTIEEEKCG